MVINCLLYGQVIYLCSSDGSGNSGRLFSRGLEDKDAQCEHIEIDIFPTLHREKMKGVNGAQLEL